jgi:hypothetical protein
MPDCEKSDLAKLRNAVAVAEEGRDGEVRYLSRNQVDDSSEDVKDTGGGPKNIVEDDPNGHARQAPASSEGHRRSPARP